MIVILNARAGAGPPSNSAKEIQSKVADAFDAVGLSAEIVEVHRSDQLIATVRKALDTAADTN